MRKPFIALSIASLGFAAAAVLSPSATAGVATFTVDPDHGLPGSAFTASGGNCPPPSQVTVTLHKTSSETSDTDASNTGTPNSDGIWSVSVTVPANASAGPKAVSAHCEDLTPTAPQNARNNAPNAALPQQTFDYPAATFTVEAAATQTPSPTPSPTPSATPPPDVAPAADAVDDTPNFTG